MNELNDISASPAYILAGVLGALVFADIRSDLGRLVTGRNVVLLAICAWYLLEAVMLPEALRREYTQEQYNQGIFHVGLAAAAFLLGYQFTEGCSLFPAMGERVSFFNDEKWLWRLVLIGAVIGFAPIVVLTGGQFIEMFQSMMGQRTTWGGMLSRGRYGDARSAFLMLEQFITGMAPFAAILLFSRKSTLVQRLMCATVVFWPILRGFGTGTRSPLVIGGGVLLSVLYWKATPAWRKRLIVSVVLSMPLVYSLMAAIVMSRNSGSFSYESGEQATYVGNEMFRELLFITELVPEKADYQYGFVYYVQLVNPIPRFLWPDKPTLDAGLLLAQMYGAVDDRSGQENLTISPGLIGEMYLNFGILGIVALSAFGGWLVKGWDAIKERFPDCLPVLMYYSSGLAVLFIMGRSFTMNMFYGLITLALLAWVIRYLNPQAVADGALFAENSGSSRMKGVIR